jgi:hypothetical protein
MKNHPLRRAVIRQCGGLASFRELASDVYNHGAACGFSGFIYYSDTVAFAKRNKTKILAALREDCLSFGESSVVIMLSGFNGLKGYSSFEIEDGLFNPRSEEKQIVYNILAWWALEEVCREECESED